jgi:uncharacterized protein (DUF2235 family)
MPKVYAPTVRAALFFDGTWQEQDDRTNVYELSRLVAEPGGRPGLRQESWYADGVGVSGNWLSRKLGGAFAHGLDDEVVDGYRTLQELNPEGRAPDTQSLEIFLFGFSRGAYTARALAGMVAKVGLAPAGVSAEDLFRYYKDRDAPGLDQIHDDPTRATDRARALLADCSPALIRFVGVWDTVGAYGVPVLSEQLRRTRRQGFRNRRLSRRVLSAAHAIAIDEFRWLFPHTAWDSVPQTLPGTLELELAAYSDHAGGPAQQRIEQRWFVGNHSNVGGGGSNNPLATITLEWMLDAARDSGLEVADAPTAERAYAGPIRRTQGTWVLSRFRPRIRRMAQRRPLGAWCRDRSVERRLDDPTESYAPRNRGFADVPYR